MHFTFVTKITPLALTMLILQGCVTAQERDQEDHNRCMSYGAVFGTNDYFGCRNILAQRRDADRDRSLQMMALGLGMAAGNTSGGSYSSSRPYTRSYNVNGRMYNCTTVGTMTNCM